MKTLCSHVSGKAVCGVLAGAMLSLAGAGSASAQGSDPNPGALTFTGALDVPSVYFFRGIRREGDPKATLFPHGDIGIALPAGGDLTSTSINFGVWNSLNTGSSGSESVAKRIQYEEDFYATLTLGFAQGVGLGTTFTAYTSPISGAGAGFATVKEISFKVTKAHMINPYGIVAFEVGGSGAGQADGGLGFGGKKGVYVELGVGPSWPLAGGKATIAVPVKVGLSAKDYYEMIDPTTTALEDNKFGFLDLGALLTCPMTGIPSQYGSWNVHVGIDGFLFGDTTKALNVHTGKAAKKGQAIALLGIGVAY